MFKMEIIWVFDAWNWSFKCKCVWVAPQKKHGRPKDTVATSKKKSTEWPGVHHPSHSCAPEDSFGLPSTYECNPAETKILRRWCVASSYLMDGKRNDVCEPIYQWTLFDRRDPITEVSMGSTMAGYKYTYWGFSTHAHTMQRCTNTQTVHKLIRVWMGGFGVSPEMNCHMTTPSCCLFGTIDEILLLSCASKHVK